jgi:hypothetical protein
MATIVLSAAGMALGGSIGGSVLGLSAAVIGRAAGATLGRVIDQRLMGAGSEPVETGRIDRFRLTGASEGAPVQQIFGRMRASGQVIWATRFKESSATSGGGKGTSRSPVTTAYSYSVSLAIALCEGQITRVGRVWADGVEMARDDLNLRVYPGSEDQLPDPKIEAVEGAGNAPAYRGIAYVVIEDLELEQFGNRVPQFSFEVSRPSQPDVAVDKADMGRQIRAVALVPGTGEYALATTPVTLSTGFGLNESLNVNSPSGKANLPTSLDELDDELPNCGSVSLVVSWFGNDLRCADCRIEPKVEQTTSDPAAMPWVVSGVARSAATLLPYQDDRPVYGGTPADAAVIEAIVELTARGKDTVFYPFILMDQMVGNALPDPWTGATSQPHLPWRGRVTLSVAPGRDGSPDQSAAAAAEVAAFLGQAQPADFSAAGNTVTYSGPSEWSYRRFILHYANLCALAGGVSAFCLGSEMRSLTQIRDANGDFPAVAALQQLAAEVRAILGPYCKIGYAADWSEYHGYQPAGTGDKLFHLDPLWADPNIDFIGIDNYMPLSDWRDGETHLDASWGSIYNLDYLRSNVAGGEGFDWYYHSPEADAAQIRTPISDFWGEDWVWRYKDLKGWWQNPHHARVNGDREALPTAWIPESKPIWFTELGCAAVDKATNDPNKFVDPKSSESGLPSYSNGLRDELIQMQYLRAVHSHFADPANNPASVGFGHNMVDMSRAHVWAWDSRPYPFFPANTALWSDGANYARGHWINGRTAARTLASVVAELCERSGLQDYDTSRLYGLVRGYGVDDVVPARSALQPLMLAYGFDAVDRDGKLIFATRHGRAIADLDPNALVLHDPDAPVIDLTRAPSAEIAGRVRIGFVDADGDYQVRAAEAVFADETTVTVSQSELTLVMTRAEGQRLAERWLSEARVARDTALFALPPSQIDLGAGDVVTLSDARYRIDRVEHVGHQMIEAVRIEPETYLPQESDDEDIALRAFVAPVPVEGLFLDLPLLRGDEVPYAPYFAATGVPWPGSVALYSSAQDSDYAVNQIVSQPSVIGITQTPLFRGPVGLWDRGPALRVKLVRGALSGVSPADILRGANVAAIGDGSADAWEVFQFAEATLVAPDTYDLTLRLRGQSGSDGITPDDWPVGSVFVLLDGTPAQIALAASARGVEGHYRYGPAARPIDDVSYRYKVAAFKGNGLRPYAVCHLTATPAAGDVQFSWIRRTRTDGDSWDGTDVPLGEDSESYLVRVIAGGTLKREVTVNAPAFTYLGWQLLADGISGAYRIEVAQLSERYGAGPFRSLVLAA